MKEVKSKNSFRERDEIEEYFSDAKKKSFPTGIIFIILLLVIVGGVAYYYFVIDNPKNIFLTMLKNIKTDSIAYEQINYNFSLEPNILTNNEEYLDLVDVINKMSITGEAGLDTINENVFVRINAFYKGKDLLSFDNYIEQFENQYLKFNNNIFDKAIKLNLKELYSEEEIEANLSNQDEEREKVSNSLLIAIQKVLKEATLKKEYSELNGEISKKITLLIDKELMEKFYNELLNEQEFMENYSDLEGITETELKTEIENKLADLKEDEVYKLCLYLSVLKNQFIMLELTTNEEKITISKTENEYNYKFYKNSIIEYQGYISIEKVSNNYEISFSIEDIENELNVQLNLNSSIAYEQEIKTIDTTNIVDYQELTEEDMNQINENISKSEALKTLIEDINSLYNEQSEKELIQTT